MSQEKFIKFIKSVFETALEKVMPPEEIAFKNVIKDFIIDYFVSRELYSLTEKADLSTGLAISNYMDSLMKQMKIQTKQMFEKHPEFLNEKHINLLVSFFSNAQFKQFNLPDLNADQKIQSATGQKELLVEAYLTTTNEKVEKLFRKNIEHLDWEIQKNTSAKSDLININCDEQSKVIGEFSDLVEQKIHIAFNKAESKQINSSGLEKPILFRRASEIVGLKERSFRAKLAAGEIPGCKKTGKWQFFESELVAWVREGKIKTTGEIKDEADKYLKKTGAKK